MFILTLEKNKDEGAYALTSREGEKILLMFEEFDDAERYAILLEYDDHPKMEVVEVEDELAIKACQMYGYDFEVITPEDIIVPPKNNDSLQKNKMA